jgi:hypothetical protein
LIVAARRDLGGHDWAVHFDDLIVYWAWFWRLARRFWGALASSSPTMAVRTSSSILVPSSAQACAICARAKKISYELAQDKRSGKSSADQLKEI